MATRIDTRLSTPNLNAESDRLSWPALSEAPDGALSVVSGSEATPDAVRLLIIDLTSLPEGSRRALDLGRNEQVMWLRGAAARSLSLLILQTEDRIELYSTERDHRRAFQFVIRALSVRVFDSPNLGQARTLEARGDAAVRHLLRRVSGLSAESRGNLGLMSQVQAAAALASTAMALGPILGALFRTAASAGRRVRNETGFGSSEPQALREVERFAAERILEEEFAAWQAQTTELRRARSHQSLPPRVSRPYLFEEPGSFVRVRVPQRLVSSSDS